MKLSEWENNIGVGDRVRVIDNPPATGGYIGQLANVTIITRSDIAIRIDGVGHNLWTKRSKVKKV